MGEVKEVDYEINSKVSTETTTNNEVSTEMTTNEDPRCHGNALIFTQPDINSLMGRSNMSSKTIGIPKTWILLDSQSTTDVLFNNELLTKNHKTILPSESDTIRG